MIEINNTFLLVWIVVLAVICIYLLYSSLTRGNDAENLRATLSNMVRQNKKRDELLNFLMERVESLTNAVNVLSGVSNLSGPRGATEGNNDAMHHVVTGEAPGEAPGEALGEAPGEAPGETSLPEMKLDDIINSMPEPELMVPVENTDTTEVVNDTTEVVNDSISNENILVSDTPVSNNMDLDSVLEGVHLSNKAEDDLISTILGNDDNASQLGDNDFNMSNLMYSNNVDINNLPRDKNKLMVLSVKQLKNIAKELNIKSRGNKNDLVDGIYEKLVVETPRLTTEDNDVVVLEDVLKEDMPQETKNAKNNKVVIEELGDDELADF